MICRNCGREIQDDASFCQFCGFIAKETTIEHELPEQETSYKVFATIAYVFGIACLITCPILGGFFGIAGIIFAKNGMKSADPIVRNKSTIALRNNKIALWISCVIIGLVFAFLFVSSIALIVHWTKEMIQQ